jgi:hypothetical protein
MTPLRVGFIGFDKLNALDLVGPDAPFGPPDLDKIQARCQTLVDEIGGTTVPLHHWENIIPPTPTEPDTNAVAIGFRRHANRTAEMAVRTQARAVPADNSESDEDAASQF